MNIEIIDTSFDINIYGFSGIAFNKDYAGTAFKLSGKMWQVIKDAGIKNKGQNIWVYERVCLQGWNLKMPKRTIRICNTKALH
jgi:hypothetical protein